MKTTAHTNAIHLSKWNVGAILNTSSGSCDSECEYKLLDILKTQGIFKPRVWCGPADQIERFLEEAISYKLDVLVVLGGDGTIRAAAERCGPTVPYLVPLPGGTINMPARALYGDLSWEEVLDKTIAEPAAKALSGGRVVGRDFFIAAIVGAPTLLAEAREAIRKRDFGNALRKGFAAFRHMFGNKVRYFISQEHKGEAEAVAIICPLISKEMPDSEQALEAAAIEVQRISEVIGVLTVAAFGRWRDNRNIVLTKTNQVRVQSSEDIPGILDGEKVNLGRSAEINFLPKAVTVLVPAAF